MASKQVRPTCNGDRTQDMARRCQDEDGKTHTVYDSATCEQCDGSGWVNR